MEVIVNERKQDKMRNVVLKNIQIAAISCAAPTNQTDANDYVEHFGEKRVKRFVKTTGVKKRYLGNGKQTAADFCCVAARNIFVEKNIRPEDVGVLIYLTQNPDYQTPSTAFVIQKRLGISKECICFDINMGCTSFLHGISVAGSMMMSGIGKVALVMMGDARLPHGVTDDTTETMIFGEAGAVVALTRGEGEIPIDLFSDGNHFDWIMNPYGERMRKENGEFDLSTFFDYMDGSQVFDFAVTRVPKAIRAFCEENDLSLEEYDSLILHQANVFILKHIANELDLSLDKVWISMDRYGNTNGASIPVTIVDYVENQDNLPERLNFLVSGFGIGLSWGVMSINIETKNILPMCFTDEYYEEAKDLSCFHG